MDKKFQKAVPILEKIEEAGFEAYFVGGSVRDFLLRKEINDVDIASSATPYEIKKIFGKTVDLGIEHGTVLVLQAGVGYEITTFRAESGYSDFRRPDSVRFIRSLEEDLKRRDFTMNAIAMDKNGRIIDPFNGTKDIDEKRIVTVGNPDERFQEDALRMMRAIRFVSQLTFGLEEQTFESLKKNGFRLEHIAVERTYAEFEKMFKGKSKQKALELLRASGLDEYLPGFPSLRVALDRIKAMKLELLNDPAEIWTLLLTAGEVENSENFLRRWKMPVKQIREIGRLRFHIAHHKDFTGDKKTLLNAGIDEAVKAAKIMAVLQEGDVQGSVREVKDAYKKLPIQSMKDLDVNGNDLVTWFDKRPGPWVKEELQFIVDGILEGEVLNRKEEIKGWLTRCNRM